MMGTLVKFTVIHSNQDQAQSAIQDAIQQMQHLSDRLTIYGNSDNPIKRFNASPAYTPMSMPNDIHKLLQQAVQIQQQSHGAFSPTLGALSLLWGFSAEQPPTTPPATSAIQPLLAHSQHCLEHIQHTKWLHNNPDCDIDLGGIAKGFIIDRGIHVLRQHGIQHAMINAGGDIRLIGKHGKRAWRIGIRHPRNKTNVIATLQLSGDVSVVTSGDYERYFMLGDKRFHHILDPQTGYPATNSQSATVIAKHATIADAWSTALFVQGEQGVRDVSKHQLEAIQVDNQGHIHSTQGIKQYLQPDK